MYQICFPGKSCSFGTAKIVRDSKANGQKTGGKLGLCRGDYFSRRSDVSQVLLLSSDPRGGCARKKLFFLHRPAFFAADRPPPRGGQKQKQSCRGNSPSSSLILVQKLLVAKRGAQTQLWRREKEEGDFPPKTPVEGSKGGGEA